MMGHVPVSYINHIGSEPPSNPFEGMIWFDTASDILLIYKNGSWNQISSSGFTYEISSIYIGVYPPKDQSILFWLDITNSNRPVLKYKHRNTWISISDNAGEIATECVSNTFGTYSRMQIGGSLPIVGINEGDLFYRTDDNKLFIRRAGNWFEIDWQKLVQTSPEWIAGRLRIHDGRLQISPNGSFWFSCVPVIGTNGIVELTTVDNVAYSTLYWIAPGVTIVMKNVNHLPVVYTPVVKPIFTGIIGHSVTNGWWIGLRPSGVAIGNGEVAYIIGVGYYGFEYADYDFGLSIVPIARQTDGWNNFSLSYFSLNIKENQKWLGMFIEHALPNVGIYTSHGVVPKSSYWLGTWYTNDGDQFTVDYIVLTRLA